MAAKPANVKPVVRDAYPHHILFEEKHGTYWLRGKDLARASSALGLDCESSAIGFDSEEAAIYARKLTQEGITVGVLKGTTVRTIRFHHPSGSCRPSSKTIGLAPELIVGRKEILLLEQTLARRNSSSNRLVQSMQAKESGKGNPFSKWGKVYVYRVAQDMYEVDEELTTVPMDIRDAMLLAAHQSGRLLKCQLVPPKPRRRNGAFPTSVVTVSEPVTYGQLRFPI